MPTSLPLIATCPSDTSPVDRTRTTLPAMRRLPAPIVKPSASTCTSWPLRTTAPASSVAACTASSLRICWMSASPSFSCWPAFNSAERAAKLPTTTSPIGALTVASRPAVALPISTPAKPVAFNPAPASSTSADNFPVVVNNCRSPPAVIVPMGMSPSLERPTSPPAAPSRPPPAMIRTASIAPVSSRMSSLTTSWISRPVTAVTFFR
ncbi:hypothetical protein D3C81_489820 [compost metagenome]